jgi:hypothetical protein
MQPAYELIYTRHWGWNNLTVNASVPRRRN